MTIIYIHLWNQPRGMESNSEA